MSEFAVEAEPRLDDKLAGEAVAVTEEDYTKSDCGKFVPPAALKQSPLPVCHSCKKNIHFDYTLVKCSDCDRYEHVGLSACQDLEKRAEKQDVSLLLISDHHPPVSPGEAPVPLLPRARFAKEHLCSLCKMKENQRMTTQKGAPTREQMRKPLNDEEKFDRLTGIYNDYLKTQAVLNTCFYTGGVDDAVPRDHPHFWSRAMNLVQPIVTYANESLKLEKQAFDSPLDIKLGQ